MATALERFGNGILRSFGFKPKQTNKPLINDPQAVVLHPEGIAPEPSYETLWGYFKQTPEVISIITAIAEDIISDGWRLEVKDSRTGRNRIQRAEKFLEDNLAMQEFMATIIDYLVTGDGYIYKAKLTPDTVKSVISNITNRLPRKYQIKSRDLYLDILLETKSTDEDLFLTRKFLNIPSSTIKANYDIHGVPKAFYQRVGTYKATLTPEEVIHFRYLRLNGEFYGFTPLASLFTPMSILKYVRETANNYFYRGGIPNYMFILEEETPESPNYKRFMEQLKQFGKNKNRNKSLVVTGKVDPKELNKSTKDMEFRQLAEYITQVIVMAWNIPAERLSNIVGAGSKIQAGTSDEGYYRKISHMQDMFEQMINKYLLKEFGVKLRFNRTYKQDEVREVQIEKIKTDVVEQRNRLGLTNDEWAWKYLNIPEDERGKGPEKMRKENQEMNSGMENRFPFQNKPMMENNPNKVNKDMEKQNAANSGKMSAVADAKSEYFENLKEKYGDRLAEAIVENL